MNNTSESLLPTILNFSDGRVFYRFSNADGKQWMMPEKNMETAMALYQPSGTKGKMMKRLFPYLYRCGIVNKAVHAERMRCSLRKNLHELLCKTFNVNEIEFAIFGGTPCVHKKITIQLSIGKRILGYCKISDNKEIQALFVKEAETLNVLYKKGVTGIPHCLYYGTLPDGTSAFVQSTIKTNHSLVLHEWTQLQETFLQNLYVRTRQKVLFEKTDFHQTLVALQQHLDWLPVRADRNLIEKSIEHVLQKYKGEVVECSAYHADFTPWNMLLERGELFVFDWEYAHMTYPPMLDRYHFFTQTAIFERHWSAEDIIRNMQSDDGKWIDVQRYLLYIVDIISRFTVRERGKVEGDMAKSFNIWTKLLNYLTK